MYIPYQDPKDNEDEEEDEGAADKKQNFLHEEEKHNDVIHPEDKLVTGSADTSIKIWNLFSGECLMVSIVIIALTEPFTM